MHSVEFTFLYGDMKTELKEMPSLPQLLASTEKTVRKLECISLYSLTDRREFDLELYEESIFKELTESMRSISAVRSSKQSYEQKQVAIEGLKAQLQAMKMTKMQLFDQLAKKQQQLTQQILQLVNEQNLNDEITADTEIKQVDQYDDEMFQDAPKVIPTNPKMPSLSRIQQLKLQIDTLNRQISKINRGRGKWFQGDHKDFIAIYNRYLGNSKKIVQSSMKQLGMKSTEIIDHLQVYDRYLQIEKEKKLVTEQYRAIKSAEQEEKEEMDNQKKLSREKRDKAEKEMKEIEDRKKKMLVDQFREKKMREKKKLLEEVEAERIQAGKIQEINEEKKRAIEVRNQVFVARLGERKASLQKTSKSIAGNSQKISEGKLQIKQLSTRRSTKVQTKVEKQSKEISNYCRQVAKPTYFHQNMNNDNS